MATSLPLIKILGGVPLVVGLGYNFSVAPKWLIGLGADYSTLSQESSSYSYSWDALGVNGYGFSGAKIKTSNRYNIFVAPGYEISEDKLVYLKAGYSSVQVDVTAPSTISFGSQSQSLGGLASNQTKTIGGYIVGLGYKQFITSGLYAFGEANYMSYGSANFGRSIAVPGSNVSLVTSTNSSLNSYQVLVGLGYKF